MRWLPTKLSDLLTLEYGKALPRSTRDANGTVPVAGSNGSDGFHSAALVSGPGIVVGRKGSAGKVTWFESDFWPIDTTYFVVHDSSITNIRWLFYLLQSKKLERLNKTTGVPGLNRNDVYGENCLLPPLKEQTRIVELLDEANHLRRLSLETDAKAARILPALFIKMFGDPSTNPMGWPTKLLGDYDVCEINPRTRFSLADDAPVSFVPMADVDEHLGRIVGNQIRQYVDVKKGFTPFQDGDVLFAKITPCMQNGKAAIAEQLIRGTGFGSTEFHVLRATKYVTAEFLFALVRLQSFRNHAMSAFTGSAGQQRVPADFLKQYKLPIPPTNDIQKFSKVLRLLKSSQIEAEQAAKKLDVQFSVMLQHAFSGKLTAKWRDERMKELLVDMEHQARVLNLPLPIEHDVLA